MPANTVDLYLRKSNKDEGRSVARQLGELTDGATSEGLTVGRVFCDPEFSASRFARRERPDYAQLLEHIRSGDCSVLGLFEGSRGSRKLTEWSTLLDECRERQVRIWIWTDERIYRPWKTSDWDALARIGVQSATESNIISDRALSGKRKAAREGRPPGRLQYGFSRTYDDRGRFVAQVPHPDEAPVVEEIVRRVAAGDTLHAIACDLNARRLLKPSGKPWNGQILRQTILSPSYAGRRVHRGEDVGKAAWEPIVDVDLWRTAVALLTQPGRRTATRGTKLTHWLSGAALCGRCRAGRLRPMSRSGSDRATRYGCRTCNSLFVAMDPLEAFVQAAVLARLAQPDALAAFQPADDPAAAAAERAVTELRARLDDHYAQAAAGHLSARGLAAVEGRILAEIEAAERAARRAVLPPALRGVDPADVIAGWPDLPPASRRTYALALVELVVGPGLRSGPGFDRRRLAASRWVGDPLTWGEHGLV